MNKQVKDYIDKYPSEILMEIFDETLGRGI